MSEATKNRKPERIAVLGGGTWGCTIAALLDRHGHNVRLWDFDPKVIASLKATRQPEKLRDLTVPRSVGLFEDIAETCAAVTVCVFVVPSVGVRSTAEAIRDARPDDTACLFVLCTKGMEKNTNFTMSQVLLDVFGDDARDRICVLSGPSHAEEVSKESPTTVTAAAYSETTARRVQALFFDRNFRVYTNTDVLGVEIGAAVKNIIAIAAGICDGLGMGDNAKAALITRGLAEIMRLGRVMGAREQTLAGLSGMGDLIVTAISRHSRNRNFGELLAQGLTPQQAAETVGMVVEGVPTVRAVCELARRLNVELPISEAVFAILYESKPVQQAVADLLGREPKAEIY